MLEQAKDEEDEDVGDCVEEEKAQLIAEGLSPLLAESSELIYLFGVRDNSAFVNPGVLLSIPVLYQIQ